MKKIILLIVALISITTIVFMGIGCKSEASTVEETIKESVVEETTDEIAEEELDEEKPAEVENIKLTMLSHIYEPWNNKLMAQINAFMVQNPNIEIEYTTVASADLYTKVISSLEAGVGPDIFGARGQWLSFLAKTGYLSEAPEDVVEDITTNNIDFGIEEATIDGKLYAYIQHIGINTPIVNKDFFDELGEEVPETWSQYVELSEKYADRDDIVITALAPDGVYLVKNWSTLVRCFGGEIFNEDLTKAAFNSPEGIEATKVYLKLSDPAFPTYDANSVFLLGKAGMVMDGPWAKTFYTESEVLKNYYPTAPVKEKEQWINGYVWNWAVNGHSSPEKQKAAWDFLKYISSDENYLDLCKTVGFISFRKANQEELADDTWLAGFQEAVKHSWIYYDKRIDNWEEIDRTFDSELTRAITEEITVEEALSNLETAINNLLSQQ